MKNKLEMKKIIIIMIVSVFFYSRYTYIDKREL